MYYLAVYLYNNFLQLTGTWWNPNECSSEMNFPTSLQQCYFQSSQHSVKDSIKVKALSKSNFLFSQTEAQLDLSTHPTPSYTMHKDGWMDGVTHDPLVHHPLNTHYGLVLLFQVTKFATW
jgi:hypothetical protein